MKRRDLPQGEIKTKAVRTMFDTIAPRYELVNHLITFNLDRRWRHRAVRDLALPAGSRVLDVAAGTGDFCRELTSQGMQPVATDLSYGMMDVGGDFAPRVQADAARLPFRDASFDGVTCGYALRNFTDLQGAISEMSRVTRPGGRVVFLEVANPRSRILRAGFSVWFRGVVPIIGGLISNRGAYRYLPKSTAYLPSVEEIVAMMRQAGFSTVQHRMILGGLSQQFTATRAV
ncbi:MAG: ubiquinone/menaquinone biosynthesis methyltransferase [Acidobacteria bacterium]|nr:ubiquinone/menaquinone biosynthesis methyltransferase [Acidobacteriota bacterium]